MSRAQFTVAISTDEEAAASKRMVIYAFSAQINLFSSFFLKQPLRNTVFILFPFMRVKVANVMSEVLLCRNRFLSRPFVAFRAAISLVRVGSSVVYGAIKYKGRV